MRTTSRKLKRLIEEEEKTLARIEELQEYLGKIREARRNEEDIVIIRSIRSMRLGARELFSLLTAIQDGNLSPEMREQLLEGTDENGDEPASGESGKEPEPDDTGKKRKTDEGHPDNDDGAVNAPEREENDDSEHIG